VGFPSQGATGQDDDVNAFGLRSITATMVEITLRMFSSITRVGSGGVGALPFGGYTSGTFRLTVGTTNVSGASGRRRTAKPRPLTRLLVP
jgi:hypothetical protein